MAEPEPTAAPGLASRPGARSTRYSYLVVGGILLCLLMGALDNFVVLTALEGPRGILTGLGASASGETFIISAYLITSTVAVPIFAKLSDIFDRRAVFLAGLFIFIGGSILSGLSQSFDQLIAFRAIQGFGSGDFFPVGLSIVAVIFPPETRARVTGLLSGVFGIATVAGPFIGSAIVTVTTWRWVFYVNIPVGLAGLALILVALGPIRPEVRGRFDVVGGGLLAGWVTALMFPLVQISEGGWSWGDPRVLGLLLTAAVLVAAFVVWELRAAEPLVPLRLLRRRIVGASGSTTLVVGAVVFPLATLITLFVSTVTLSASAANPQDTVRDVLYFLVIPLVFGAALGGSLLIRFAYRPVALLGVGIATIGLVLLTPVGTGTPLWTFAFGFLPVGGVVAPLIPAGFGAGLTFPVFLLAVQNQVPEGEVGAATGLVQFLQSLGGALGLTLLSSYINLRVTALSPPIPSGGCSPVPPISPACAQYFAGVLSATATAFDEVFWILAVLLALGFVASLFLTGRLPRGRGPMGPVGGA